MTTWVLQGHCPACDRPVQFVCSREEATTASGHRVLCPLVIVCPEGHRYEGTAAEEILQGVHPEVV